MQHMGWDEGSRIDGWRWTQEKRAEKQRKESAGGAKPSTNLEYGGCNKASLKDLTQTAQQITYSKNMSYLALFIGVGGF